MAILAHPVDCISSCHILKAQHCCLSPNDQPSASHPPPIESIHDITGTEKLSSFQVAYILISYDFIVFMVIDAQIKELVFL